MAKICKLLGTAEETTMDGKYEKSTMPTHDYKKARREAIDADRIAYISGREVIFRSSTNDYANIVGGKPSHELDGKVP